MKFIRGCIRLLVIASLVVVGCGFLFHEKAQPLKPEEIEAAIGIPYKVQNIPISKKRPGNKRRVRYIVIHNTANPNSTAQNERDYLVNPTNVSSTSFHIVIDEHEIIEAIPTNEVAFHAGAWEGNQRGIGIEICESEHYAKAEFNAVKLTAYLMKHYHLPIEAVKTHHDFSGKNCPRLILGHWDQFLEAVEKEYRSLC